MRTKSSGLWRGKKWLLRHDNPPAHSSLLIRDFLTKHETTFVPQPPNSPELASADFFLFTKMKLVLKGRRFEPVEEITENSPTELRSTAKDEFQECLRKKRWERCIRVQESTSKGTKPNNSEVREKTIFFILFGIFTYRPRTAATSRGPLQFISSFQSPYTQFKTGWWKFPSAPRHVSHTHTINPLLIACGCADDTTPCTRLPLVYRLGRSQHTAHQPQHHVAQLRGRSQEISYFKKSRRQLQTKLNAEHSECGVCECWLTSRHNSHSAIWQASSARSARLAPCDREWHEDIDQINRRPCISRHELSTIK